ncbi:MAG: leucine-rich repeat domain-containing protein [Bacteroidia bacterium]|nr:leucine-rich repeat domain-containing protein [Bacteroidia bacterium]
MQAINTTNRLILIFAVLFFAFNGKAQLLDSLELAHADECTSLDSALKHPDKIIKLVLRKQKLKKFPEQIFKLKNLQYLDLSKNNIREIPEGIGELTQLQYLAVSKTGLDRVAPEIGKLKNLKYINLNQNELVLLPPQFGDMEKLEIADLWSNNLNELPATMGKLKNLKVLDLRNILFTDEQQRYIQELMPNTTVHMSPSCKCKW